MTRTRILLIFAVLSIFTVTAFAQNDAGDSTVVYSGSRSGSTAVASSPYLLSVDQTSITGPGKVKVTLTKLAESCDNCASTPPPFQYYVLLSSSSPACTFPISRVTDRSTNTSYEYSVLLAGETLVGATASVEASCSEVSIDTPVMITDGITATGSFVLQPILSKVVARTSSIASGTAGVGRVRLNGPAPSNIVVSLASAKPAKAGVPASVIIPAGASFVDFPITAGSVASDTKAKITATYTGPAGITTDSCLVTIVP